MSLEKRLQEDLKAAMKSKDQAALRSVRSIKAAIMIANTDGSGAVMDDAKIVTIVQKLIKQRKDSLDIFEKQGREDLAVTEREEIEVISKYLPAQLSAEELKTFLSTLIQEMGAEGMKDMGKVMGAAGGKLAGKAEGKAISLMVKELLTQ